MSFEPRPTLMQGKHKYSQSSGIDALGLIRDEMTIAESVCVLLDVACVCLCFQSQSGSAQLPRHIALAICCASVLDRFNLGVF